MEKQRRTKSSFSQAWGQYGTTKAIVLQSVKVSRPQKISKII